MKEKLDCLCADRALVIPRPQATYLAVGSLGLGFFIFVGGFFLGYTKAARQMGAQAEQESFADAIEYSLSTQFGANNLTQEDLCFDEADDSELSVAEHEKIGEVPGDLNNEQIQQKDVSRQASRRYQALVFGGTQQEVKNFISKMNALNLPVELRRRVSTTKKGAKYVWYQAVTKPMDDEKELSLMVKKIEKHGHLKKDSVQIKEVI